MVDMEGFETNPVGTAKEIKRLRRALDNIKVRAYELGQRELHDQALAALESDSDE
jgi:hypothetical protein